MFLFAVNVAPKSRLSPMDFWRVCLWLSLANFTNERQNVGCVLWYVLYCHLLLIYIMQNLGDALFFY